ncbi:hypothetical protein BKA62DRAFT_757303 [Auriculariales sp. MPI-PUGE-AT-0066]|nr:hypothetical protein BKA62DRAFT_757303 [Auriculariales sp. MPI-PUGE-AT-0066]
MLLGAASASGSSNPRPSTHRDSCELDSMSFGQYVHSSSEPPAAAAPNDQLHPWPTRRIGPLEITGYVDSTAGVDQLELRFEVYFHPSGWTTNSTYYQQFFAPIFACTVDLRHPDYGMSVSARFRPPHSTCITGEVSCGVVVALDTTGYERRWLAVNHHFLWQPLTGGNMVLQPPGQPAERNRPEEETGPRRMARVMRCPCGSMRVPTDGVSVSDWFAGGFPAHIHVRNAGAVSCGRRIHKIGPTELAECAIRVGRHANTSSS